MTTTYELSLEVHIPMSTAEGAGVPDDVHAAFPWIATVEEFIGVRESSGELTRYSEAAQSSDDTYVFHLSSASETKLISAASDIAKLPGVPEGAFAKVSADDAESFDIPRLFELPVS